MGDANDRVSDDFPVREDVLRNRLGSVRDDFQLVLIEAPPVLASPDAVTLASVSDAAILSLIERVGGVMPWVHIQKLRLFEGEEGFTRAQGQ